jgi:hypothetical protein
MPTDMAVIKMTAYQRRTKCPTWKMMGSSVMVNILFLQPRAWKYIWNKVHINLRNWISSSGLNNSMSDCFKSEAPFVVFFDRLFCLYVKRPWKTPEPVRNVKNYSSLLGCFISPAINALGCTAQIRAGRLGSKSKFFLPRRWHLGDPAYPSACRHRPSWQLQLTVWFPPYYLSLISGEL